MTMAKGFGSIPNSLLYNKKLSSNAKVLFATISNLSALKGYCFANNKYLSDLLGFSDRSIRRHLRELKPFIQLSNKKSRKRQIKIKPDFQINPVTRDHQPGHPCPSNPDTSDRVKVPFSRYKSIPKNVNEECKYNIIQQKKEKDFKGLEDYSRTKANSEYSHTKIQQLKRELLNKIRMDREKEKN